jgi:hypothetical protein
MKTLLRAFIVLALLFGMAPAVYAQNSVANTTLSAAVADPTVTPPANVVTVASATCANCSTGAIVAGTVVFVDREAMIVTAVSSTTLTVRRGQLGTRAQAHPSGAIVYLGSPDDFDVKDNTGACTSTQQQILPHINILNANIQVCDATSGLWRGVDLNADAAGGTWGRTPVAGTAAYTILPTDYIIGITTMTAARTFTLPAATGLAGKTYVIVDESGAVSTSNTLTISGSFNASHSAIAVNTAFGSVRIYSNGSRWFQW